MERKLDLTLATRPHWIIPEIVTVVSDDTWTSGNLTKQAARWKEIFAVLGDKAATDRAMAEEAARYGTKVGSTVPGVVPGTKPATSEKSDTRDNPYKMRLDDPRRQQRIEEFVAKSPAYLVRGLAKAANCEISGRPL